MNISSRFSHTTVKSSSILVDAVSVSLLNGSSIHFATELIGSSFWVLNNPHATAVGAAAESADLSTQVVDV